MGELLWAPEPEPESPAPDGYARVVLKLPLHTEFTYAVPDGMQVRVGSRVRVPFRGRGEMAGVVVGVDENPPADFDPRKVKPIGTLLDPGVELPDTVVRLARRIADEYGCSLGEALDATLPASAKARGRRRIPHLELAVPHDTASRAVEHLEGAAPTRARVLRTILEYGAPIPVLDVRRRTKTSDSPWQTLVRHGTVRRLLLDERGEELEPDVSEAATKHELNEDQRRAFAAVAQAVDAPRHEVFLLHGVTGSGKTEVYLQILERVRAAGRTAIVLVPEISLTPQTVGRFASRFPGDVAVLHSGLTDAQRGKEWQRLARGEASIVVGARSALFAPLRNVGLVVVDEEHESTFKQESTPRYHAREMAVARGELEQAAVVLGSATPSLESYGRAKRGVYTLLELPARAGAGRLPKIVVEDLRRSGKREVVDGVILSRPLVVQMQERLRAGDQVLLFLNRRGFSPALICPKCGEPLKCTHCDVTMTWHARRGRAICHYCCEEQRRPDACPACSHDSMHDLGFGTERVESAIRKVFPDAMVARMDADTMVERGAHERVLAMFRRREIDVLIGTQMIAKGLDFPDVTLVGVISADTGLFMPDFRAAERTFQLLYQVAGRAGRAEKEGLVIIQTLCPDNYAVRAAAELDYAGFVRDELSFRRAAGYPPYARLVRVICDARGAAEAEKVLLGVRDELIETLSGATGAHPGVEILGPAPAVVAKIKDRFRANVLVKCATPEAFSGVVEALRGLDATGPARRVRLLLDVDPQGML